VTTDRLLSSFHCFLQAPPAISSFDHQFPSSLVSHPSANFVVQDNEAGSFYFGSTSLLSMVALGEREFIELNHVWAQM
jgi:hypothetical protein